MLQWTVAILAILALIAVFKSDIYCSKSKHSDYYANVKKPCGKEPRTANIPNSTQHDLFFTKLNNQSKSH